MSAPARLAAFGLLLAALFAGGFLIGRAVDPDVDAKGDEHEESREMSEMTTTTALLLRFRHAGAIHTARFTVDVGASHG